MNEHGVDSSGRLLKTRFLHPLNCNRVALKTANRSPGGGANRGRIRQDKGFLKKKVVLVFLLNNWSVFVGVCYH